MSSKWTATLEEATMTVVDVSLPFHVHSYPDTGLLRKMTTGFKFSGLFSQVFATIPN